MYAQKQKNREDSRENTSRQMKSWKNIDFIRMPSDLSASNSFDSSSRLSCNPPTKFGQGKAHKDGKLKDLRLPFISREGSKQQFHSYFYSPKRNSEAGIEKGKNDQKSFALDDRWYNVLNVSPRHSKLPMPKSLRLVLFKIRNLSLYLEQTLRYMKSKFEEMCKQWVQSFGRLQNTNVKKPLGSTHGFAEDNDLTKQIVQCLDFMKVYSRQLKKDEMKTNIRKDSYGYSDKQKPMIETPKEQDSIDKIRTQKPLTSRGSPKTTRENARQQLLIKPTDYNAQQGLMTDPKSPTNNNRLQLKLKKNQSVKQIPQLLSPTASHTSLFREQKANQVRKQQLAAHLGSMNQAITRMRGLLLSS